MADSEEKAVCSHCNKEVAMANLPMHEAHCQRFLSLCPECDEQVPKEQLEQHRVEQHTSVKCKKCKMKMEKCQLSDHEINECTERLQSCEFCQLELPFSNLKEHIVACGSRTERCEDCDQYVKLKDQVQHAQTCMSEDTLYDTEEDLLEDKLGPSDLFDDSSKVSEPDFLSLSLSAMQKKGSNKTDWADQDLISTCPLCHLALPVKTLQWHEKKCRIFENLKQKM